MDQSSWASSLLHQWKIWVTTASVCVSRPPWTFVQSRSLCLKSTHFQPTLLVCRSWRGARDRSHAPTHSQCLWLTPASFWTKSTRGMHRRFPLSERLADAILAHVVTRIAHELLSVRKLREKMNQRSKFFRHLITSCTATMKSWHSSFRPSTNPIAMQRELPIPPHLMGHVLFRQCQSGRRVPLRSD